MNSKIHPSELHPTDDSQVMGALTEDPDAPDPERDARRLALLTVLDARIEVLTDEEEDDENELRARPGPMVPFDEWSEVARAVGCTTRTLARLRRGADVPTERMLGRLSYALLTPPELVLTALRRPWTGWRW